MLFQHGSVAHLGERLICIQEVEGSIPFRSTKLVFTPPFRRFKYKTTMKEGIRYAPISL